MEKFRNEENRTLIGKTQNISCLQCSIGVEALRYKTEGRWFHFRWGNSNIFVDSVPSAALEPWRRHTCHFHVPIV